MDETSRDLGTRLPSGSINQPVEEQCVWGCLSWSPLTRLLPCHVVAFTFTLSLAFREQCLVIRMVFQKDVFKYRECQ